MASRSRLLKRSRNTSRVTRTPFVTDKKIKLQLASEFVIDENLITHIWADNFDVLEPYLKDNWKDWRIGGLDVVPRGGTGPCFGFNYDKPHDPRCVEADWNIEYMALIFLEDNLKPEYLPTLKAYMDEWKVRTL